jgi:hypothetical protein
MIRYSQIGLHQCKSIAFHLYLVRYVFKPTGGNGMIAL